jgi:hypothetical protein
VQAVAIDVEQKCVCALEVLEESDSNESHCGSTGLCVRERLGDNLKVVLVNYVSHP